MKDICLLLTTVVSMSLIYCEDGPTGDNLQINLTQTLDVTSGRHHYELSCADPGISPTPQLRWFNVNCSNGGQGSTCTFEPIATQHNIQPECTSRHVTDNGTKPVLKAVLINFAYPVLQGPQSGSPSSDLLHTGDNLTCSLATSKPLVGSVHFACTDPTLDDQPDVNNATSVSSFVTVDVAHATEKDTTCVCSAVLDIGNGFYHISTAALFSVEHKAKVKSLTLNGTDTEITVNESDNATLQLVCKAFGRPNPKEFTLKKLGNTSAFANITVTETGNWTSQAAVTLSDIQCRDMGTYSCTAHTGLVQHDTTGIKLNVRCPPKTTVNETMNMTIDGIVFMLEAYPVPHDFVFTHLDKGNITKGRRVSSDNFRSTCKQDRDKEYILNCRITPVYVPKRLRGMYHANVSNGIGSVEVAFQIRIEDSQTEVLNGKSTSTGLIVGCVIIVIIVILVVLVAVLLANNRRRCMRRRTRTSTRKANHAADNTQYLSPEQVPLAASGQASDRSTQSQTIDVSRYIIDSSTNPGNCERVSTICVEGSSRASPIGVKPSADVACTSVDVNVDCTNIAGQETSNIVFNSQDKSASKGDNDTVKEPKDNGSSNGNHDIAKRKTDNSASKADNGTPKDKDVSNDTTDNGASKGENGTAKGATVSPSSKQKSPIYNNDISPACISRPEEPKAQPTFSTSAPKKPPMYKNDVSPPCTSRPTEPQAQPKVRDYANEEAVYTEIDDLLPAPALTRKQGKVEALYAVSPCYGTPGYKDPKSPGHVNYQEPSKLTPMKNDVATNRVSPTGGDLSTSTLYLELPTQRAILAPGSEGDTYDVACEQRSPSYRDDTYSHID